MAVRRPENAAEAPPDVPRRDGLDRYAIYVVKPIKRRAGVDRLIEPYPSPDDVDAITKPRRRVYETTIDGIGRGIEMLYEEGEIPRGWRVGVLDRLTRFWLVNPFA